MIICKVPFRISFVGGGTDFPEWYIKNSGKVISSSIDKFNFVTLRNLQNIFNYKFRIRYYYNERFWGNVIPDFIKFYNLKNGDKIRLEVDALGSLENKIVSV